MTISLAFSGSLPYSNSSSLICSVDITLNPLISYFLVLSCSKSGKVKVKLRNRAKEEKSEIGNGKEGMENETI